MPDRMRRRTWAALVALAAVPLLGGGQTTLGRWSDSATVPGTTISTVAVTTPQVFCGSLGPEGIAVSWLPVQDATGYRVYLAEQPLLELGAGATGTVVAVPGTVTVTTLFGSWESSGSSVELALAGLPTPALTCS